MRLYKSRGHALFVTIAGAGGLVLALVSMVLNFHRVASWLPLLVIMLLPLGVGIASLRAQRAEQLRGD